MRSREHSDEESGTGVDRQDEAPMCMSAFRLSVNRDLLFSLLACYSLRVDYIHLKGRTV